MFYNYIKMINDLYAIMDHAEAGHKPTLRIMLDECVMHFLEAHNVPFERQGEFLTVMFPDCPRVIQEYKIKKFDYK